MRKATTGNELTEYETARNKTISKVRYIVEQYFGLSHLYNKAYRATFPKLNERPRRKQRGISGSDVSFAASGGEFTLRD